MMKVIDNFFKDSYAVRKLALSSTYPENREDDHNWPGDRAYVEEPHRSIYVNQYKKVFDEPAELGRMYFQSIEKSYCEGVCHPDDYKYTVITYLNLEPPLNSGTEIYGESRESFYKRRKFDFNKIKTDFNSSNRTLLDQFLFKKNLKRFNSIFKNPCVVSNKFNRTVIFYGDMVHRAQNFFGTTVSNSRLTLVSFYK